MAHTSKTNSRRIVQHVVDRPLTLDELRAAVTEMCPEGNRNVYYRLAVFTKSSAVAERPRDASCR